ncbi:MAG: hypothetical protein WDN69_22700 [Aliidongia sp.]
MPAVALDDGLGAGAIEAFLVAEIILQCRQADLRRLGDTPRRHGREGRLAEGLQGGIENPPPRLLALAVASGPGLLPRRLGDLRHARTSLDWFAQAIKRAISSCFGARRKQPCAEIYQMIGFLNSYQLIGF